MTCLFPKMQVANAPVVTAAVPPIPPSETVGAAAPLARFWALLCYWVLRTPLTALILFCVISITLKENYPFSNFPMYSNPSPERPYYMLANGQGEPIPVAVLTGVTCPKVGKIYRTECQKVADKLDMNKDKLPPAQKQAIGEKMFAYFRDEAASRKQVLPDKLQLIRKEISYQNGAIAETSEVIAKE